MIMIDLVIFKCRW